MSARTVRPLTPLLLAALSVGLAAQQFQAPSFYATGQVFGPFTMAAADFDGDGDLDLVGGGSGSPVSIQLNQGDGSYASGPTLTAGPLVASIATGDLNADGDQDIVVSNNAGASLSLFFGNGNGTFTGPVNVATVSNPRRVRLADLDGDNDLDIVVAAFPGEMLFNNGAGSFPSSTALPIPGVVQDLDVADINGDGDQDIVATTDVGINDERVYQLRNNGLGSFSVDFDPLVNFGGAIELADIVPGGSLELVMSISFLDAVQVFSIPNSVAFTSLGVFSTGAGTDPGQFGIADFDVDGDLDVIVSDVAGMTAAILLGDGTGSLSLSGSLDTAAFNPSTVIAEDLNGDGKVDAAIGRPSVGSIAVFLQGENPDFRKPMITEVSWGNPDYLEITNFGLLPQDMTGWTVAWKDGSTTTSAPLTQTLIAGESLVLVESGASLPMPSALQSDNVSLPNIGSASGDFAVALIDPNGLVVDEVRAASFGGAYTEGSLGGTFRGTVDRTGISGSSGCIERIWGLDSNGASDWTTQITDTSPGYENRSSGPRSVDPIPVAQVLINEVDDNPDYIEFVNRSGGPVDMNGWFLLCDATQGGNHTLVFPWNTSTIVQDGEFFVIGDASTPPAELPGGVSYVDVTENIPWNSAEFDCALYDNLGRLVDLMRTTGHDDQVVHNHPRAPSHWADFTGAAPRLDGSGDDAIARGSSFDSNTGADWRPVFARTMGFANSGFAGPSGHGDVLDYRVNRGALGGGFTVVVNAGTASAGFRHSIFASYVRTSGTGPFFGLGADALPNWVALNMLPPWGGTLDANGSLRFDFPPGTLPSGLITDIIAITQQPSGAFSARTLVVEYDS